MRLLLGNLAWRTPLEDGKERFLFGTGCRFSWSLIKRTDQRPRYAMLPLFLAYAAAVLERDGFDVQVIDGVPLNLTADEFCNRAIALHPDVLVFEPCTATFPVTLGVATRLREATGAKVIFAGTHVSSLPMEVMQAHPQIDYVLIGEFERTLLKLAQSLRDGKAQGEMRGVAYRGTDGRIIGGAPAENIEPLDWLPFPARHLFPSNNENDLSVYHDGFCQHRPAIQMHSSRGCPWCCDFCLWNHTLYGATGRHRTFSPERVVDEMVEVEKRYGAKEFYFDDDALNINKQHALAICAEITKRGMKTPWSMMSDLRQLDANIMTTLAKAGCIGLKFGVESLADEVQAHLQKEVALEKIREVTRLAGQLGIKTHATVCMGLPGETTESLKRSFDYCCQIDTDSIQFYISTPFHGTPFYAQLKKENRVRSSTWTDYDATRCIIDGAFGDPQKLEDFVASAGGRWLKRKVVQPRWVGRQAHYLTRIVKGQGLRGLTQRFGRAVELLSGS